MAGLFHCLMNEVTKISGGLDLGFNQGLKHTQIEELLKNQPIALPDDLLSAYELMNGNRRIEKEGKLYWDQSIVPFFKGAFHFISLQESLSWINNDVNFWIPKGHFPIASRVERDYLSINLATGELVVLGTYTLQQTVADSFNQFVLQYTSGLQDGSYVLDVKYPYYPRIVHYHDVEEETLRDTFTGIDIG